MPKAAKAPVPVAPIVPVRSRKNAANEMKYLLENVPRDLIHRAKEKGRAMDPPVSVKWVLIKLLEQWGNGFRNVGGQNAGQRRPDIRVDWPGRIRPWRGRSQARARPRRYGPPRGDGLRPRQVRRPARPNAGASRPLRHDDPAREIRSRRGRDHAHAAETVNTSITALYTDLNLRWQAGKFMRKTVSFVKH